MKTPKIAVVTTCDVDYERYFATQSPEVQKQLVKVTVLRDIKEKEYAKCVLLIESDNVTDRVKKNLKAISSKVENLRDKTPY